jgi:hypothetical protein
MEDPDSEESINLKEKGYEDINQIQLFRTGANRWPLLQGNDPYGSIKMVVFLN